MALYVSSSFFRSVTSFLDLARRRSVSVTLSLRSVARFGAFSFSCSLASVSEELKNERDALQDVN